MLLMALANRLTLLSFGMTTGGVSEPLVASGKTLTPEAATSVALVARNARRDDLLGILLMIIILKWKKLSETFQLARNPGCQSRHCVFCHYRSGCVLVVQQQIKRGR